MCDDINEHPDTTDGPYHYSPRLMPNPPSNVASKFHKQTVET